MLKDKLLALLKTLHQRPRSRLVPLPATAERFVQALNEPAVFGAGNLMDVLLKLVRDATSLDIVRNDIKLDMVAAHHFMHLRVVDEHGRQLGQGRNLGALKAELGGQARGAFQALASHQAGQPAPRPERTRRACRGQAGARPQQPRPRAAAPPRQRQPAPHQLGLRRTARADGNPQRRADADRLSGADRPGRRGGASRCLTSPKWPRPRHREGLRRLFALQIKDALKYLEKNLPGLQAMAAAYMQVGKTDSGSGGGTLEELRNQIIELALDRAFLIDPLPTDEAAFKKRVEEGRGPPDPDRQRNRAQGRCDPGRIRGRRAQAQRQQGRRPTWRPTSHSSCSAWCPSAFC